MRTSMRAGLTAALKARDRVAVAALRSALSAIDNAEAVSIDRLPGGEPAAGGSDHVAGAAVGLGAAEVQRRHLTDADLRAIVEDEVRERTESAAAYERAGRAERAERLRVEAEVLTRYLGSPAG